MSKKKNPRSSVPPMPLVQLSQCMIVKNEEKNIEKALSWGKGIVFEKIVVDTGSTDRTVELAKGFGAQVYHFDWIDDFAAAKNYAIEQATGNWIAFLDADEYFLPKDAKMLMMGLKQIMQNPQLKKAYLALNCPLVNLDNNGNPFSVVEQDRVFRNMPGIRYTGRIHEILTLDAGNIAHTEDITIYHTGYSDTVYNETGKLDRNIKMLRREISEHPEDINLKDFLADALYASKDEKHREEAINLYHEVMYSESEVNYYHRQNAYEQYIKNLMRLADKPEECLRICREAVEKFPDEEVFRVLLENALIGEHS